MPDHAEADLCATTILMLSGGMLSFPNTANLTPSLKSTVAVDCQGVLSVTSPATGTTPKDLYFISRTTNLAADFPSFILVCMNPSVTSLPNYLQLGYGKPGLQLDATKPWFFPLGLPILYDQKPSSIANATSFATGSITFAPELIGGGRDNVTGTNVSVLTSSLPSNANWGMTSLQGSTNQTWQFKTNTLSTRVVVFTGNEPIEMITDNQNSNGFVAQQNVRITDTTQLWWDALNRATFNVAWANGGGIPDQQTAPLTIAGTVSISVSAGAGLCGVSMTVIADWITVDPITGQAEDSVFYVTTINRWVQATNATYVCTFVLPQSTLQNPTQVPGGFVSYLVNVRVELVSTTALTQLFRDGNGTANFSLNYQGRMARDLENNVIEGITGSYPGSVNIRYNARYEVQPTKETVPLLKDKFRRPHWSWERDNFVRMRDILWDRSPAYQYTLNEFNAFLMILRERPHDLAASLAFGTPTRRLEQSPVNGTLVPQYNALSVQEVLGAMGGATRDGLSAFFSRLARESKGTPYRAGTPYSAARPYSSSMAQRLNGSGLDYRPFSNLMNDSFSNMSPHQYRSEAAYECDKKPTIPTTRSAEDVVNSVFGSTSSAPVQYFAATESFHRKPRKRPRPHFPLTPTSVQKLTFEEIVQQGGVEEMLDDPPGLLQYRETHLLGIPRV